MKCVVVVFWHVWILDKVECTSKEANREASLPPVAWLADRLVLCLHPFSTSLLLTPESLILDWTQGLSSWYEAQYELQYDIVPLSPLNITLLITPKSLKLDSGHENRALCIYPSPGSSILDRRQPIVEIILLASLIQLSIQPLSVGSAKACATKAIWKAASKKIYTNNYFSGKWNSKLKAIANWMRSKMTRSNIMHGARKERLVGANKTMILCNSWRNWPPW